MDGINNDVGLDDVDAGDGENKFDLGYVHGGGGDGNDAGVVHDIGGVDFNGGDDVCCGDVETKVDYGDNLDGSDDDSNDDGDVDDDVEFVILCSLQFGKSRGKTRGIIIMYEQNNESSQW